MAEKLQMLTKQLPPVRVTEAMEKALLDDLKEDNTRFRAAGGRKDEKLSGHIRWILEKHLADKKARR
jgi:hypothetical protein